MAGPRPKKGWRWGTEQAWSERAGASPAAGLFPVEVDWPAPEVKVVPGELPLWWAERDGGGDEKGSRGDARLPTLNTPTIQGTGPHPSWGDKQRSTPSGPQMESSAGARKVRLERMSYQVSTLACLPASRRGT